MDCTAPKIDWPELTFPKPERALVKSHYDKARVILEYGSGGSTVHAARQADKLVFSVENDRRWALDLQAKLDRAALPGRAIVYPVDIGPVGAWGRPLDDRAWPLFHRYPMQIWTEDFFRHPDLVLIDGRFRPACFAATCLLIERPVTVLFDDYFDRPTYALVETLEKPVARAGRMAVFNLEPRRCTAQALALLMELMTQVTFPIPGEEMVSYETDDRGRPLYHGGNARIPARWR